MNMISRCGLGPVNRSLNIIYTVSFRLGSVILTLCSHLDLRGRSPEAHTVGTKTNLMVWDGVSGGEGNGTTNGLRESSGGLSKAEGEARKKGKNNKRDQKVQPEDVPNATGCRNGKTSKEDYGKGDQLLEDIVPIQQGQLPQSAVLHHPNGRVPKVERERCGQGSGNPLASTENKSGLVGTQHAGRYQTVTGAPSGASDDIPPSVRFGLAEVRDLQIECGRYIRECGESDREGSRGRQTTRPETPSGNHDDTGLLSGVPAEDNQLCTGREPRLIYSRGAHGLSPHGTFGCDADDRIRSEDRDDEQVLKGGCKVLIPHSTSDMGTDPVEAECSLGDDKRYDGARIHNNHQEISGYHTRGPRRGAGSVAQVPTTDP